MCRCSLPSCLQGGLCFVGAEVLKDGLFHRGVSWVPVTCEIPQGRKAGAWWMPWNQTERPPLAWGEAGASHPSAPESWVYRHRAWGCSLGMPGSQGRGQESTHCTERGYYWVLESDTDECGNLEFLHRVNLTLSASRCELVRAGSFRVFLQLWKTFSQFRE